MKIPIVISVLLLLLACTNSSSEMKVVNAFFLAFQEQDYESLEQIAPVYADFTEADLDYLSAALVEFYGDRAVTFQEIESSMLDVMVGAEDSDLLINFKLSRGEQDQWIIPDHFTLVRNIDFIPAD